MKMNYFLRTVITIALPSIGCSSTTDLTCTPGMVDNRIPFWVLVQCISGQASKLNVSIYKFSNS